MIACLSPNGDTSFEMASPPLQLLVGSSTGVVRLARDTVDAPWRETGRSLQGKHIGALVNADGGRLFAGCHGGGGVFRSVDGGDSWQPVGREIVGTDVYSLAVLDTPHGQAILAGVEPVNLYRSDDFGETWIEHAAIATLPGAENWTFPPPPHVPHLKAMTIDGSAPDTVYACVEQGALLKTEDAGRSWRELDAMWTSDDAAYRDAHRLVVAPWNPQLLVFASGIGVYRSTDGGGSWQAIRAIDQFTSYPDALIVSPSDRAIYVGGPKDVPGGWIGGSPHGTVCRSDDEGRTWLPMGDNLEIGPRANVEGLAVVTYPGGYTLFLGDTDGYIFSSDDRAETWRRIARTEAVSKGAHFRIAQMSGKLPAWVRPGAAMVFMRTMQFTARRAAKRRRAEFASRAR